MSDKNIETGTKPEEDTLNNVFLSGTIDKYSSEFESATDEDIGSILEEMSKLVDTLSSSSASDCIKLEHFNKNSAQKDKSLEELLEEAEELVRSNSCSISEKILKSDVLDSDSNVIANINIRQFDTNIFQRIEEEVHRESEKSRISTERAKKKRFQNQAEKLSITSNIDDLIERDSRFKWLKNKEKTSLPKNNLKKELTDVDENFFEDALSKSVRDALDVKSSNDNLEQENCSLSPKSLQMTFEDNENNSSNSNCKLSCILKNSAEKIMPSNDRLKEISSETYIFSAKEITENFEKMFSTTENLQTMNELIESSGEGDLHKLMKLKGENDNNNHSASCEKLVKNSSQNTSWISGSNLKSVNLEISDKSNSTKELNSKNDMYTVNLTPRLELFADTISKLMTEKSSENAGIQNQGVIDEKKESLQCNIKETAKNNNLKEMNRISTIKTKEVAILPPDSMKNEDCVTLSQKTNEISESCNPTSEFATNLEFHSASQKSLQTIRQRKKPFPRVKVVSKSNSNFVSKVKLPLKPKKDILKSNAISKLMLSAQNCQTKDNLSVSDWKGRYHKEEAKTCLLKKQLDLKEKFYKAQIKNLRSSFEQELFSIKKQNIVLKDKIDELYIKEKRSEVQLKNNSKLRYLEKELEEYKRLTDSYEAQKNKFMKDKECLQEEVKDLQQKIVPAEVNELQEHIDHVRELQDEICKLNLEVSKLKQQNLDHLLRNDDVNQQNCLLKDELKMFKEQLNEKNNFIAERLQALTTTELKLRKQIEDLKVEINTKTESLKVTKLNYEKLEHSVLPLEKELLELRVKEGNLQEKLAVAKNHAEREKQLSHKLKNQVILDSNKIMDLTRQVREMERIIKRKNPDSVSALILTANSEQDRLNLEKIKLLEIRNTTLENEMKVKEEAAQQRLADFRKEFAEMKKKYTIQIVELEEKLLSAPVKEKENYIDMSTQTMCTSDKNKKVEACEEHKKTPNVENSDKKEPAKLGNPKLQNKKNDAHLIAIICKLKLELSNKNKALSKLSKEFQELQKTNRRLQKEREKQLNDMRPVFKNVDSNKKNNRGLTTSENGSLGSKSSDINYHNSNASSIECEWRLQEVSAPTPKLYDPLRYSENSGSSMMKSLVTENGILKEELSKMKKDLMTLKNKRLCDLNLLQEEHERELTTLIQKYNTKEEELNVLKLEGKKVFSMHFNTSQESFSGTGQIKDSRPKL